MHEDGKSLDYSTLYGGSGNGTNADNGAAVAIDANGNGYITGATFSTDLTTVNAAVNSFQGQSNANESNAYVAEFTPTLSGTASLVYATYLGGSGSTGNIVAFNGTPISLSIGDAGTAITIDPATNDIWVAGLTASTDFTGIPGAAGATTGSPYDIENQAGTGCNHGTNAPATAAFFLQIDPTQQSQSQILYSTYFGGCGVTISIPDPYNPIPPGKPQITKTLGIGDAATDIAIAGGKVFITGTTTGGAIRRVSAQHQYRCLHHAVYTSASTGRPASTSTACQTWDSVYRLRCGIRPDAAKPLGSITLFDVARR